MDAMAEAFEGLPIFFTDHMNEELIELFKAVKKCQRVRHQDTMVSPLNSLKNGGIL